MATTVRLLSTYNGYKPQSIITVDDSIATQLIQNKNATLDLTGGTQQFQPAPQPGITTGTNVPAGRTVSAGQSATVVVPAGLSLSTQGTATVAGTREILNPDGSVVSSAPLSIGADNTGVFLRDTAVRFSVTFGSLDITPDITGGRVELDTKLAGENFGDDWQETETGATSPGGTVMPGAVDQLLGSTGAPAQYLKRINAMVSPVASGAPDSRVVRKEGTPVPKKQLLTHGSTASTTTVINTAVNVDSVPADFYKNHLVRVGNFPYRKILSHGAFAANAVNQYTLDQPLPAAPAINILINIENPTFVVEVLPYGMAPGPYALLTERRTAGNGWRISTGADVVCDPIGKFENA